MSFVNTLKNAPTLEDRFFTKMEPLLFFVPRNTTSHQNDYQPYTVSQ